MIEITNTVVPSNNQWEAVILGLRNPMNSWEKSDSGYCQRDLLRDCTTCVHKSTGYPACFSRFEIGKNDRELMMKLRNSGTDHRKFMRMIVVYVDITAPLYWWKEADQYKVGTVTNSCSTMHKIADKKFTIDDFSTDHLIPRMKEVLDVTIFNLNACRNNYLETKDKTWWWQMIQLLPSSYNQKRTVMLNYEVLANMYKSRKNHKLDEWRDFCEWIESLPYSYIITGEENGDTK